MVANTITLCRLLLTFAVMVLFGIHRALDMGLIATIAIIFALDGIDGYIARRRNETSKLGQVLDTVADRIIENTFWIYFTTTGHLTQGYHISDTLVLVGLFFRFRHS